jgi:pimeloyl-ACP methyl ester carboxylesterase
MINDIYSKHHLLKSAGGPISVYESGNERLSPVLLLHGAMYDEARLIWYHLAPFLAKSRRVLAIDFPGHGQSRPWSGFVGQKCLNQVVGSHPFPHCRLSDYPWEAGSLSGIRFKTLVRLLDWR